MTLNGQTAVVTGASRGIGRGIACALAGAGAKVACIATSVEGAASTIATIGESGGTARAYACDVSDPVAVEGTYTAITADLGDPQILVNNAGITRDALLMRMSLDDWERVIDVNLRGSFLWIKAVSRAMMKARYGRIVNISSIVGVQGGAGQVNYAASKAGIHGMTMSVARELGSRGVTCNTIAPGFIETDMTAELTPELREQVLKGTPAGRLGTPQDVSAAVLFLASPESAFVTGQIVCVDGGLAL